MSNLKSATRQKRSCCGFFSRRLPNLILPATTVMSATATLGAARADRRVAYIRGLYRLAKANGKAVHQARSWQFLCDMMAKIGIYEACLPSKSAACEIAGFGQTARKYLTEVEANSNSLSATSPPKGRYCSAAAAMLVALLEHVEAAEATDSSCEKEAGWCPLATLLLEASKRCEQTFRGFGEHVRASVQGAPHVSCTAFQQVHTLMSQGYVKVHVRSTWEEKHGHRTAYEILEKGRQRASRLRRDGESQSDQPVKSHRRVQPGESGVVLLCVDEREGGGAHRVASWESLIGAFIRADVRFETRWLGSGAADCAPAAPHPACHLPTIILLPPSRATAADHHSSPALASYHAQTSLR